MWYSFKNQSLFKLVERWVPLFGQPKHIVQLFGIKDCLSSKLERFLVIAGILGKKLMEPIIFPVAIIGTVPPKHLLPGQVMSFGLLYYCSQFDYPVGRTPDRFCLLGILLGYLPPRDEYWHEVVKLLALSCLPPGIPVTMLAIRGALHDEEGVGAGTA